MKVLPKFLSALALCAAVSATTTFAAGLLPSGYTEIEYIQGNGSNARIVTDYTPNPSTDKIELEVEWPANTLGVNQAIWCARGSDTTVNTWTMFMLGKDGDNKLRFDYKSTVSAFLTPAVSVGTKYTVTVDRNAATWTGGNGYSHPVVSGFTAAGGPVMLFASYINGTGNNLGNYGKQKLYSFKVWRSGNLIHYFVPCKDSNGAATMVDICDNPATLSRSGTFTAGQVATTSFIDSSLFASPYELAISGAPGQYGSPSPAYGKQTGLSAGDTVAVSCESYTNTTLMVEYICTGWKMYNENNEVVSNGTVKSFTYTHPSPAEFRKIEWQWSLRALSSISDETLPVAGAAFHVDASMPSTLTTVESGGKRIVTEWRDADGGTMKATAGSSSRPWLVTDDGLPYVDFGPQASGNGTAAGDVSGRLAWSSSLTTVREVFLVYSDYPGSAHSFFLGANNVYHFHRNQKKMFNTQYASTYVQNGLIEVDGVARDVGYELPEGFHIIHLRTTGAVTADRFAQDRAVNFGGQRLQEVIVYTSPLTDAEAQATYDYLEGKWVNNPSVLEVDGSPDQIGSPTPAYGIYGCFAAGATVPVSCGESPTISASGTAYVCTGWKLYDGDGNVLSNGTETSFTYTHPTPAEYRNLEWQWTELLTLLPIPDQVNETFDPCRPELTVSNRMDGTTWTVGGNLSSPDFDVAYTNNFGANVAIATVTGRGEFSGIILRQTFNISATKLEDENIYTTDVTARRHEAAGKYVYVFTNAAAKQVSMVKRQLLLTDYLVAGGGGGGGNTSGGGGGGGGVTNATGLVGKCLVADDTFTVSVGAGGAGAGGYNGKGANGKATSFRLGDISVSVAGGGGGGSWFTAAGVAGASGGGGTQSNAGGAGIDGLGHAGATGSGASASGGGGGAGHDGYLADATAKRAGNGGEGVLSSITGEALYYGGGGGGGGSSGGNGNYDPGFGGPGGGGDGEKSIPGHPGVNGLGGGGGGGGWTGSQQRGGNGGSGTVILAFKPSDFNIDPIPPQILAAGGACPNPVVRPAGGSTVLTKDVDYEVAYTDNDAVGTAMVTVTGIGTYAGRIGYATFLVVERYHAKPVVAVEGDGTSWATAMSVTNLFATLGTTTAPCEVWIAAGTVSAQALSITNNADLVIRGGFAGTETTLDERQPGAFTVFDGENTAKCLLKVLTGDTVELVLDRLKFYRANENGFIKTGTGSLKVLDCVIEGNGKDVDRIFGRGMNVSGGGSGVLVVSNCVFKGNVRRSGIYTYGGFGLYVNNFSTALVDDSLFVTNGYSIAAPGAGGNCGADGGYGGAMRVIDTPVTVRRCHFAGNVNPLWTSGDSGGVLMLNGACGGSLIDHCVFIGNTDRASGQARGDINTGGALALRLSSATDKVRVRNCTFAYNIAHGHYSAGGISVATGDVDIDNSIFWKNTRARVTTVGYGSDVQVSSGSKASIRNSLVTTLDGTALAGAGLTIDETSVFAADPKLVTTTEAFTNLLTVTSSAIYYNPGKSGIFESLAAMDAHLLSPAGYVVNGGAAGPATTDYSPAIDMGDPAADYADEPAPNGGRLNLGAFGNTAEASRTAYGQPNANVEVLYPDDEPRPLVRITMGLESGTAYAATVHLLCSTGGVTVADEIYYNIGNGQVLEYKLPSYLPLGTAYTAAVTISATGAEDVAYNVTKPAMGTYPPFYGKGGGPNVIHVRTGADCKMDGTSWTDAYPSLDAAFASAPDASKTEMWLAVTNDYMSQQATLSSSLTISGGFAGVENSADERTEGEMTRLDGNSVYRTMNFSVASGATLTIERIRFSHSANSELNKAGAGNLTVRDCLFTDSIQSGAISGRGISASGGTITVSNCKFTNLIGPANTDNAGGDGIYLNSCTAAYIDDCLFVTNGLSQFVKTKAWQARHRAAGAWVNATPAIFRNCRFAANMAAMHEASGYSGIVYFSGASGGSKLVNCTIVGNSDTQGSQSGADIVDAGAIICNMATTDATLDIENCTIAYNLTQGQKTAAGITIIKGTVNVNNSVVYGNFRGLETEAAGADIEVKSNGTLNMTYSLVTGLTSNYVHAVEGGTLNLGRGVLTADPLLATTTNDFHNLMTYQSSNPQHWYLPNSARGACAALDVHPRTRTGYMVDGVLIQDPRRVESPTTDAGDPASDYSLEPVVPGVGGNGHRINIGAYGNTPEAAMTPIRGTLIIMK